MNSEESVKWRRTQKATVVLVFCWLLRTLLMLCLETGGDQPDAEIFYLPLAQSLFQNGEYALVAGVPFVQKLPGYPILLGFVLWVFGPHLIWPQMVQVMVDGLLAFFLFRAARVWFDERVAWWAAFLYLVQPFSAFYVATISRDAIFSSVLVFAFYCWTRLLKNFSSKNLLLWALMQSLALYFREDGIYFFGFFFVGVLALAWRERRISLFTVLSPMVLLFFLLLPWMVRNQLQVGAALPFGALRFSRIFVVSNVRYDATPQTQGAPWGLIEPQDGPVIEEINARLSQTDITYAQMRQGYDDFDQVARKYLKLHGVNYGLVQVPKNVLRSIFSSRMDRFAIQPALGNIRQDLQSKPGWCVFALFMRFLHATLYLGGWAGLLFAFRKHLEWGSVLAASAFPIFSMSVIGQTNPRYEIPAIAFLALGLAVWRGRQGALTQKPKG